VSGFVFLLANPEFYSHLASWRVVIRTPTTDLPDFQTCTENALDRLTDTGVERAQMQICVKLVKLLSLQD
jgi:hypothetical protein